MLMLTEHQWEIVHFENTWQGESSISQSASPAQTRIAGRASQKYGLLQRKSDFSLIKFSGRCLFFPLPLPVNSIFKPQSFILEVVVLSLAQNSCFFRVSANVM